MKTEDFVKLIESGVRPVIEFNKDTEMRDYDPDVGMRARVTSIVFRDECWTVVCDLSEFEEYNKQFEIPNFYDENGQARLKWSESIHYPLDKLYRIYLDEGYDIIFSIIDDINLYNEYSNSNSDVSYVIWLEKQLLSYRNNN